VLILDEAQNLSPDLLEEVRLLGNLEGQRGKALQAVLLAQPAIEELLELSPLQAFAQRLAAVIRLEPLALHESADYLVHHLRAAGGRPEAIATDEALTLLAQGTRGVPRLLNRAAHRALALAHQAGADQLDAEAATEALAQLGLTEENDDREAAPAASALPGGLDGPLRASEDDAGPLLSLEEEKTRSSPDRDLTKRPSRVHRLFAAPRRPA
jgi:hypothetical protein